jgi:hypothetical protein
MANIRILEETSQRLVISNRPLTNRLIKTMITGGGIGGLLIAVGLILTEIHSYTGSLTTLECIHQKHLTCKMTQENARGVLTESVEISPVQKVDIVPIAQSEEVCSGSGEDRECHTVDYYECQIGLRSPQTSLVIPISELTRRTRSLSESCPDRNAISFKFEQLISGAQKVGIWTKDTRVGDTVTPFKQNIAAYIPAVLLGGSLLFCILTHRQKICTFDRLTQTAELQTRTWLGTKTQTWSTQNLTLVTNQYPSIILWVKEGDRYNYISLMEYKEGHSIHKIIDSISSFLSGAFRSYKIENYILDQTPDFLGLYGYNYSGQSDYHGSLIWLIDRPTKKIVFGNDRKRLELDWEAIQALQIVRIANYGAYHIRLVTNSDPPFVLLVRCDYSKNIEKIGALVEEFLRVPLTEAELTASDT